MTTAEVIENETAGRNRLLSDEAAGWDQVLNYYRKVAREYNAKVEAEYKPLFEALLKQVDGAYTKGP
jgi:hypothetical protein